MRRIDGSTVTAPGNSTASCWKANATSGPTFSNTTCASSCDGARSFSMTPIGASPPYLRRSASLRFSRYEVACFSTRVMIAPSLASSSAREMPPAAMIGASTRSSSTCAKASSCRSISASRASGESSRQPSRPTASSAARRALARAQLPSIASYCSETAHEVWSCARIAPSRSRMVPRDAGSQRLSTIKRSTFLICSLYSATESRASCRKSSTSVVAANAINQAARRLELASVRLPVPAE